MKFERAENHPEGEFVGGSSGFLRNMKEQRSHQLGGNWQETAVARFYISATTKPPPPQNSFSYFFLIKFLSTFLHFRISYMYYFVYLYFLCNQTAPALELFYCRCFC